MLTHHTHTCIYMNVDGHLGGLAVVNSTVMNIGVQVSFQIIFFSGHMPRSGIPR